MKKYLLPESGNFYKANLHCHSTYSDGQLTPAELKEIYKEKGYSIIAYTDHNIMIDHSYLADEDFLPLIGYEMDVNEQVEGISWWELKTCHLCYITLDPANMKQVCFHRNKYLFGGAPSHYDEIQFYEEEPEFENKPMFDEEIRAFIRCCKTGEKERSHIDSAINTAKIMQAIYDSSDSKREIVF